MATIETRKTKGQIENLTDKRRNFCQEYVKDYNASAAAIRAGYSKKSAHVQACRLLGMVAVRRYIGYLEQQSRDEFEIERAEILQQLAYCATRDPAEFVDENGTLIQDINQLPRNSRAAIDGIEQEVKRYTISTGEEVEEVRTKFKLVSKISAIDLAMKHKGLFAAEKQLVANLNLSAEEWDRLQNANGAEEEEPDEVEQKLLELEKMDGVYELKDTD